MIVFQDKFTGATIGTSRKVMSSFFALRPFRFTEIPSSWCDWFITRDPYDRVVSIYADKLRAAFDDHPAHPQRCQRWIAAALRIDDFRALRAATLPEFVGALPVIAHLDEHLVPQIFGVDPARIKRTVKMNGGLNVLAEELGIDFSKKENYHPHEPFDSYFHPPVLPSARNVVQMVYALDFEIFGYPK